MLKKFFGDSGFWKATVRLALPIALQNLLMSSFSLVDTLMVGQLGDVALSSVGMAGQWSWLLGLVTFGLCSGSAVFISQYWGIKDMKDIRGIYGIMLINTVVAALIFTVVGIAAPEWVVGLFNKESEVIASGASYLRIAAFSYVGTAFNMTFSTLLRSTESVKLPMFASMASTLANAVLNYGLIFGKFGLPELGVAGAAYATVISAWIAPSVLLIASFIQKNLVIVKPAELFGFGKELFIKFYKIASPVILNESMWGLGTLCYNIVFGRMGYESYAAITILRTVEGIAFVFFVGLCNACCVIVGKKIGAGEIDSAVEDARRFFFLVPLFSLIVGVGIVAARVPIVTLFNLNGSLTEYTKNSVMGIMLVYGLELFLRNIPYIVIVGIFRSGGDTKTGMKYDLFCVWFLALPLTILSAFVFKLPFVAVYAIMLLSEDLIKVVFCIRRFLSLKWIQPLTNPEGDSAE